MVEMINIGFSSVIPKNRIIGIDETGSSPIKRMIKRAKDENRVIDVSHGRKIKSVIWLDNGTVYLSSVIRCYSGEPNAGRYSFKIR